MRSPAHSKLPSTKTAPLGRAIVAVVCGASRVDEKTKVNLTSSLRSGTFERIKRAVIGVNVLEGVDSTACEEPDTGVGLGGIVGLESCSATIEVGVTIAIDSGGVPDTSTTDGVVVGRPSGDSVGDTSDGRVVLQAMKVDINK